MNSLYFTYGVCISHTTKQLSQNVNIFKLHMQYTLLLMNNFPNMCLCWLEYMPKYNN